MHCAVTFIEPSMQMHLNRFPMHGHGNLSRSLRQLAVDSGHETSRYGLPKHLATIYKMTIDLTDKDIANISYWVCIS